MKKAKKVMSLVLVLALLVSTVVSSTLAYLTDEKVVTNTFTAGNVSITLDEAVVTPDGVPVEPAERTAEGNEYHLIPGLTYVKDPTIHTGMDSEPSYVYVKVDNGLVDIEAQANTIAAQLKANGWALIDEANGLYVKVDEEGNPEVVPAGTDLVVFEEFTISTKVDNETIAKYKYAEVVVNGYAVQAAGWEADLGPMEIYELAFGPVASAPEEAPATSDIYKAMRINTRDVEIYFGTEYEGAPVLSDITITDAEGNTLTLNENYGQFGGVIWFDDVNLLTVRLNKALSTESTASAPAPAVKVTVGDVTVDAPYVPYYTYETVANCGITIHGSRNLIIPTQTMRRAAEMVDTIMAEAKEDNNGILQRMIDVGCTLAIFGPGEHAYYIPEHRNTYDPTFRYVEGFGGTTCSITEANIWHWLESTPDKPLDDYYTLYWDESVLTHEFCHGVKISGIDMIPDKELANEYQMVYRHAKAAGLWPNSYAISNSDEYFATLSAIWFNVMNESNNGDWDGTRGPINTRKELYNYDIDAYKYFSKIYAFTGMGENWEDVKDRHALEGLATEEPVDGFEDYVFNYPQGEKPVYVPDYTHAFRIINHRSSKAVDANGAWPNMGLWWDYGPTYPDDNVPKNMFEEVAPAVDGVYTVRIRNLANGYVYVDEGGLMTGCTQEEATVFTIKMEANNLATISCDKGELYVPDEEIIDGSTFAFGPAGTGEKWRFESYVSAETKPYILFAHDTAVNGSEKGALVNAGETVEITAVVPEGKTFTGWKVVGATVADAAAATTTLTVGSGDAVIWALYE